MKSLQPSAVRHLVGVYSFRSDYFLRHTGDARARGLVGFTPIGIAGSTYRSPTLVRRPVSDL